MKKLFLIFFGLLLGASITGAAYSAPFVVQLNGSITSLTNSSNDLDISDIQIGESISYRFLVDLSQTGYSVSQNGDLWYPTAGNYSGYSFQPFYNKLLNDMVLKDRSYPYMGNKGDWKEKYYGQNVAFSDGTKASSLASGSEHENMFVRIWGGILPDSWTVGLSGFTATEIIYDMQGQTAIMTAENMSITSITPYSQVPVPGSLPLLLAGLAGLSVKRRK